MKKYLICHCPCGCGGLSAAVPLGPLSANVAGMMLTEWVLEGQMVAIVDSNEKPVMGCRKEQACLTNQH